MNQLSNSSFQAVILAVSYAMRCHQTAMIQREVKFVSIRGQLIWPGFSQCINLDFILSLSTSILRCDAIQVDRGYAVIDFMIM
jgi:hypothetical protein